MEQQISRLTIELYSSRQTHRALASDIRFGISGRVRMVRLLPGLLWRQFLVKYHFDEQVHDGYEPRNVTTRPSLMKFLRTPFCKARALIRFLHRMLNYNKHRIHLCRKCLESVASTGERDVILYGDGEAARILCSYAPLQKVHIKAICPLEPVQNNRIYGAEIWLKNQFDRWDGTIIVAAFVNIEKHVTQLHEAGIAPEKLVLMRIATGCSPSSATT